MSREISVGLNESIIRFAIVGIKFNGFTACLDGLMVLVKFRVAKTEVAICIFIVRM
jgi:hypothetical protein